MRRLLPAVVLAVLAGCSSPAGPTALRLEIQSDLSVPDEANRLVVLVRAGGQEEFNQSYDLQPVAGGAYWPQTLNVLPGTRVRGEVELVVAAVQEVSLSRTVVVEQRVVASFREGEVVNVPVALVRACIGVQCGPGGSCQNGACVGGPPPDGGPDLPDLVDVAPVDQPDLPRDLPDGADAPDLPPVLPPEARCPGGDAPLFFDDFTQGNRFWSFGAGTWTVDSGVLIQSDDTIGGPAAIAWIGERMAEALDWTDVDVTVGFRLTGLCEQTVAACQNRSGIGLLFRTRGLAPLTTYLLGTSLTTADPTGFILFFDAFVDGRDLSDATATCCFGGITGQPTDRILSVQVRGSDSLLGFAQAPDPPRVLNLMLSEDVIPRGAMGLATFNATAEFTYVRVCPP